MKKVVFAAAAAAMLLYAPLAQAATVFDFNFTGTLAALSDPTSVNGTGKVTVEGLTGSGFENATKGGLSPTITDLEITMNQYQLDFGNITTAAFSSSNGNFLGLSLTGQDTLHGRAFELATTSATDFAASASKGDFFDGYIGTFSVTQEGIGTVPEPATWAMLVLGFGGIGVMLRLARRRHGAITTA